MNYIVIYESNEKLFHDIMYNLVHFYNKNKQNITTSFSRALQTGNVISNFI